jgi:ribose 5-phosphate isomerase A
MQPRVDQFGTRAPVPVEIVAFGLEATQAALQSLGASANLRRSPAGEGFVTDSDNRILDCRFGAIADPARLEQRIRRVVGVIETGLFIGLAHAVFVAGATGLQRFDRPDRRLAAPA